jgi:hypothetical protein
MCSQLLTFLPIRADVPPRSFPFKETFYNADTCNGQPKRNLIPERSDYGVK